MSKRANNYAAVKAALANREAFEHSTMSAKYETTGFHYGGPEYRIYSYGTVIGYVVNDTLYANNHKYSVTTSKHQGIMRGAFRHLDQEVMA